MRPTCYAWWPSGFKVLVQHQYPGYPRNQGVARGSVPTIDFHGARRIESQVGDRPESPSGGSGDTASAEYVVARTRPASHDTRLLSRGSRTSPRAALGSSALQATEGDGPPALAHGGLPHARTALVSRTDCKENSPRYLRRRHRFRRPHKVRTRS